MNIVNAIKEYFKYKPKFKKDDILSRKDDEDWEASSILILEVGNKKYKYLYLDNISNLSVEKSIELKLYYSLSFESTDVLYQKKVIK